MSNQEITVIDLLEWKKSRKIEYAAHHGKGNSKRLLCDMNGGYTVIDHGETVLETIHVQDAVSEFNSIKARNPQ